MNSNNYYGGVILSLFFSSALLAQENYRINSSESIQLKEIVVLADANFSHLKQTKPLSSIDEYLEESSSINMIKRGAYAWEPNLNGMSSERLSVTIDGMQIFGACTDKMDPITSYVEIANLSEAHVSHGQKGNEFGNTIGGGLDLKLKKGNFVNKELSASVETGYETNNQLKIGSAALNYDGSNFFLYSNVTYKDAENYTDGDGNEVLYSQYSKINTSLRGGMNFKNGRSINASFIYDKATDVGYPALTMDVSLAKAYIASISYNQKQIGDFRDWETKFYWNDITHVMDDTTRPDVPIHMDMPGWSTTYGLYSKLDKFWGNHHFKMNLNAYLNESKAEMTMYPEDPNENLMFMLTWPDVQTLNSAIYVSDKIKLKDWNLKLNTRLAIHNNNVRDEFGLNSLKIFYPNIQDQKTRFLKSLGLNAHKGFNNFHLNLGLGYGERAPSVSEAYGFYLFNSFDNYDYVGKPDLPNEKSIESSLNLKYALPSFEIGLESNVFLLKDYIIGEINNDFAPMTIGAAGIKVYNNLKSAIIANVGTFLNYKISSNLNWSSNISYHIGEDSDGNSLPLISPISYQTGINYNNKIWFADVKLKGATKQTQFSSSYGEDETPAYQLINFSVGKLFAFSNHKIIFKTGVENLLDQQYSTYTDWNNIPRMGRNIFFNLSYNINQKN